MYTNPGGDWHSLREVREGKNQNDNVVRHDDKYYKKLFIQPSSDPKSPFCRQAILLEFRDGKLEDKTEQPYKYDAQKGEITLYSDEGTPMLTLLLRQMAGEKDLLYVKPQLDFVYTVYERMTANAGGADAEQPRKSPTTPRATRRAPAVRASRAGSRRRQVEGSRSGRE